MFTLLAVAVVIVGLVFLASRADAIRARRRPPQLPLRLSVDELGVRDGRFRRFLDWLRREWAAQQERSRNRPSGFGGFGGFGGGGGCGFGGGGGGGGCGGGGGGGGC